jgi:hypothetical protein
LKEGWRKGQVSSRKPKSGKIIFGMFGFSVQTYRNIVYASPPILGMVGREGILLFTTMIIEDNTSFRQVVKHNLQDRFPSMHFLSKGSIKPDEIFKLVESILIEKGFNGDGSGSKNGICN